MPSPGARERAKEGRRLQELSELKERAKNAEKQLAQVAQDLNEKHNAMWQLQDAFDDLHAEKILLEKELKEAIASL